MVKLIISIILTLIGFMLLSWVFKIASWSIDTAISIAAVVSVILLIWQYMQSNKK